MIQPPKLGIVLVEYNAPDKTNACIASLLNGTFQDFAIYIIDNSTTCNTRSQEALTAKFGGPKSGGVSITYHRNNDNAGFAAACNQGIKMSREAGATHTMLLNYDTVVDVPFLETMIKRADSLDDFGILGAKIRYKEPCLSGKPA